MCDPERNFLNDEKFDAMLQSGLPELPPEDIVQEVTPWHKAIYRALIGIAFNTFTLNFLGLNYILPAIASILSLLGFRSLRRENRWFLGWFSPIVKWCSGRVKMLKQSGQYRFFRCKSCGQTLRVPKKRGKIQITCPKCGAKMVKKT